MNYLVKYYEEIKSGNIIVGQELKKVLDGLILDLDNPKFIFDELPGEIRINFIEKFCKHTKSPFNGEPFLLELWEKAVLQVAYGFKYKDTGLRGINNEKLHGKRCRYRPSSRSAQAHPHEGQKHRHKGFPYAAQRAVHAHGI